MFDTISLCVSGITLKTKTVGACPLALTLHRFAAYALRHKATDHSETVVHMRAWRKALSTTLEQCQDYWADTFGRKS